MERTKPGAEESTSGMAVEPKPEHYYLELPKMEALEEGVGVAILVRGQYLGDGSGEAAREIGSRLMGMFLASLCEMPPVVKTLVLVNDAILLACEQSPVLNVLETIEKQGTEVVCCSTSCNYFRREPVVGSRAGMFHIVEMLLAARKVITV
ncbi:MAG: hypothetical protein NUV93_05635 [Firmicutes bacterium]|jgi:hypothetical protein|nr:hypothetical protein [Bacillota bacterium]